MNDTKNNSLLGRARFIAGDVTIQIACSSELITPQDWSYEESLGDLTGSFSITLPDTPKYSFPSVPFLEARCFIDGQFFKGGYLVQSREEDTTWTHTFIGYGYQLAKVSITNALTFNLDGTVNSFLDNLIKNNIKSQKVVGYLHKYIEDSRDIIGREKNIANYLFHSLLKGIEDVADNEVTYQPIQFLIYDPFDLGVVQIKDFQKDKVKNQNIGLTILDYVAPILKIDNIFLKCLGKYEDLKLDDNKIYNKPANFRRDAVYFVIQLWRPNYNSYNIMEKDVTATQSQQNSYQISVPGSSPLTQGSDGEKIMNVYNPNQYLITKDVVAKNNSRVVTDYSTIAGTSNYSAGFLALGFTTYSNIEIYNRIQQPVYDIAEINYIQNSSSSNVIKKPVRNYDYQKRYDCYIAQNGEINNSEDGAVTLFGDKDPSINDGSTTIIKFDSAVAGQSVPVLLRYEMNKRISESYNISCLVLGYRHGLNANNVNHGVTKKDKPLWGVNQLVKLKSQSQGIEDLYLVENINMTFNSQSGCLTELKLVLPSSYSIALSNTIEIERKIYNTKLSYMK